MAESRTAPFAMHGAREAVAGGLSHLDRQVDSIERAVVENPGLTFDLAKALVEGVCRAVLGERSIAFADDDDLPKLFKTAASHLPFLPPAASSEIDVRESLRRTLAGLTTAIQGICELRNRCGFASHGSGTARPTLEATQALLAAGAADAIVGFIHRVHRQDRTPSSSNRALYEGSGNFNDSVDESHGTIRIFEAAFRPSEVLFTMEPESYRVYLAEFQTQAEREQSGAGANGATEVGP